jgi:RimJ/RimL family protein N-acetyltransferase
MSDWDVARWLSSPPWPYAWEDAQSYVERAAVIKPGPLPLHCAIARKTTDELMGVIGLVRKDGNISVDYWLARANWNQGIMTRALTNACAAVFDTLPDTRILSYVFEGNQASLRVQERLGFEVIGEGRNFCRPREMDLTTMITELQRSRFAEAAA